MKMCMQGVIRPLGLCLVLLMASCAAPTGPGPSKVRQARRDFENRTQLKTTNTLIQGTVGGAVIGAALGAVVGGHSGGRGYNKNGAWAGGVIGGLGGAMAGNQYAQAKVAERRRYAAMEENLNNAIANSRSANARASRFNAVLRAQLRTTKADSRERAAMIADARAVVAGLDRDIRNQKQALAQARQLRRNSSDANDLRDEIGELEREKRALQREISRWTPADPDGVRPSGTRL